MLPSCLSTNMPPILMRFIFCFSLISLAASSVAGERHHWETESGAKVIFVQSEALPMVDIAVDFAAGAAFDPVGKEGLARLTLQLLDKGSTTLDEQQLSDRVAMTGSNIGGSFDLDRAGVTLRTLSHQEQLRESIELLATILGEPIFPENVIAREVGMAKSSLRERNSRPGSIASKNFYAELFGEHPYRSNGSGTEESITSISRSDIVSFYNRFYRSSNAFITIVGDMDLAEAKSSAELLSNRLPNGVSADREEISSVEVRSVSRELILPHPASQAHIRIGAIGLKRGDPDYLPLLLANQILGGSGMTSILYDELREKRGLTYGVYSYFSPLRDEGPFVVSFQTKKEQVWEALDLTLSITRDFFDKGPNEDQLERAKKYFIGAFALNVDSNAELLTYYSTIGFYELPNDYIDSFTERVNAVTLEEIKDSLKRRMSADEMVRVIVGPESRPLASDG